MHLFAKGSSKHVRWVVAMMVVAAMGCSDKAAGPVDAAPENPGGTGGTGGTGTGAVATVVVSPAEEQIDVGATKKFTAVARNAAGQNLTGFTVSWSIDNASRATINADGEVRGLDEGDAIVTATIDGKKGTARVMVIGPPEVEG